MNSTSDGGESSDSNTDEAQNDIEVSASELVDFMILRAERNPQAFIVLMEMRFSEIIFTLQRAESRACPELYCAGLRYAMLLTINTNANNYVEMICNIHVDRVCMSEAERVIHDNFILFRTTRNGKSIFLDRCVEWTMRDIRRRLGKFFKESTPGALTRMVLQMGESNKLQDREKGVKSTPSRKSTIKLDNSFLEPYVWCEAAKLWLGKPQRVQARPYYKRASGEHGEEVTAPHGSTKQLYSTDKGETLYADVMRTVSRGEKTSEEYWDKYHRYGNVSDPKRSKKVVNISQVQITDKMLEKEIKFGLSLKIDEIVKDKVIYTIPRVRQELALLNSRLLDLDLDEILPQGKNKQSLVEALIAARKVFKVKDPLNWEADVVESVTE